jgi:hypothetical protein
MRASFIQRHAWTYLKFLDVFFLSFLALLGGAATAEGQGAVNAHDMDRSSCGFGRVRSRSAKILKGAKKAAYFIFGAVVRYRRATAGSSHDDVNPVNSALHTGAVRPHTGFVGSIFFISPHAGHGSSNLFEKLPAFSCIS